METLTKGRVRGRPDSMLARREEFCFDWFLPLCCCVAVVVTDTFPMAWKQRESNDKVILELDKIKKHW